MFKKYLNPVTMIFMKHILIIEDDNEIRTLLKDYLNKNSYITSEAADGNTGLSLILNENYDLILLDLMLPGLSGEKLLKELRSSGKTTPVIVISAKSLKNTRLDVLRMGADDYLVKPFDLDEVLVRMEVVMRRSEPSVENTILSYAGIELDTELNCASVNGNELKLTSKEMNLLKLFLENPKKTFSKANLYESVWNETYIYEDNTINVHLSNLRNKLKKAGGIDYIETVWGIGYKLKAI